MYGASLKNPVKGFKLHNLSVLLFKFFIYIIYILFIFYIYIIMKEKILKFVKGPPGKKYTAFAFVISDHKDTSKQKRTAPAVGMLSPV